MLITLTILFLVSTVAAYVVLSKNRTKINADVSDRMISPNARPLFAPTDAELRDAARRENSLAAAKAQETARLLKEETDAEFRRRIAGDENFTDRKRALALIAEVTEHGDGKIFAAAAAKLIAARDEKKIKGLSQKDLADLLASHLSLLPQQERTSGTVFWLKKEIENLRSQSEAQG